MNRAHRSARAVRAGVAGALALTSVACLNVEVPEGARVTCKSNDECPQDYVCRDAIELCVPARSSDSKAPRIEGASVEPAVARVGSAVTVTFQTDEPLLVEPEVELVVEGGTRRLAPQPLDGSDGTLFSAVYVPSGDEGAGVRTLRANLVDESGNVATNVALSSVTFDFAAPALADVTVSPSVARDGTDVAVTVRSSEPLADSSTLTIVDGRAFTLSAGGDDPLVRTFTLALDAATDAEGNAALALLGSDAAGNVATRILEGAVRVDFTPPAIDSAVVLARPVVGGGQVAVVSFHVDEAVADVSAELAPETGGAALALTLDSVGRDVVLRREIGPSDPDGVYVVRLTSLVDEAGNAATATDLAATLVIDQAAPSFVAAPVSVPAVASRTAGLDVVTVSFTLSEAADVLVLVGDAEVPCSAEGSAPAVAYTCARGISDADVDGVYGVTVTAIDAADNTSFATAPSVTYDFTPPAIAVGVVPNRQVRAGEVISLSAVADEPLDPASVVLDTPGLAFSTPVTLGRTVTATFAVPAGVEGTFGAALSAADLGGNLASAVPVVVEIDGVAPSLASFVLSSSRVAPSESFTLTVTPSEPLADAPRVTFANGDVDGAGAPVVQTMELVSGPSGAGAWVFSGVGPASGVNQFYTLTVVMEDLAGNPGAASPAVVIVDNAPPTLAAFEVAPPAARSGDVVRVVLTASETLAGPPAVVARNGASSFALVPGSVAPGQLSYVFTMPVTPLTAQGTWTFDGFSLVDEANNSGTIAPDAARTFVVDSVAPTISNVALSRTKVAAGTAFDVSFTTSEPVQTPSVLVDAFSMALVQNVGGTSWLFRYTASGAEPEGLVGVTLSVADAAGNVGVAGSDVEFDFTPPAVVATSATPAALRAGSTLTYTISVDEQLAGVPLLGIAGGAVALGLEPGTEFVYTAQITGAEAQGARAVTVTLEDVAGNTSVTGAPVTAGFSIDTLSPSVSGLSVTPARARSGSVVTVGFSLSEAVGAGLSVRVGAETASCSNVGLVFSCSVTAQIAAGAGSKAVVVTATDAAGNVGTGTGAVEFDFTAPALLSTTANPAVARAGDVITYTIAANEPLASTPSLTVSGASATPFSFRSGTEYSFQYTVTGSETSGARTATVALTDVAGNTTTLGAPTTTGFAIDVTAPTITPPAASRTVLSTVAGFNSANITFTASDNPGGTTPTVVVRAGAATLTCSAIGQNFTCPFAPTGAEPQGATSVIVSATDAAGNLATASLTLTLDFTAPSVVGTPSLVLTPASSFPTPSVTAARAGTNVRVGFTLSEPLAAQPAVQTTAATPLVFSLVANTNPTFLFESTVGAPTQGTHTVRVTGADPAGNPLTANLVLSSPLIVDTVAPASPGVSVTDRIVYTRAPWGDSTGTPQLSVTGGASAVEANNTVLILRSATIIPANELLRVSAGATGAFSAPLDPVDRAEVFVASFDAAGNVSPAARVRDVSWTATMGDKVPGSFVENPHRFEARTQIDPTREQADATEVGIFPTNRVDVQDGSVVTTTGTPAWREVDPVSLTPLADPRMAFDFDRGVAVMMGRSSASVREFDGAQWHEIVVKDPEDDGNPDTGSPFEMVYDPIRGETVLWGGLGSGETWAWNGSSWRLAAPEDQGGNDAPLPRFGVGLAWHDGLGQVILFGGNDGGAQVDPCEPGGSINSCFGDIWAWDGSQWNDVSSVGGPAVRAYPTVAYDFDQGNLVVFGGVNPTGAFNDTWTWDGFGTWQQVVTSLVPARSEGRMVHDPFLGGLVLFGGADENEAQLGDQWFWDGADWSPNAPSDPEADGNPTPRYGFAMAYDPLRNLTILHGGDANVPCTSPASPSICDDTWLGTTGSWRRIGGANTAASLPIVRQFAASTYHRTRGTILFHGGTTPFGNATSDSTTCDSFGGRCNDLWEWDGAVWRRITQSGTLPGKRSHAAMAYSTLFNTTVMFGGASTSPCDGSGTFRCDGTFLLNASTGAWTRILPATRPSGRMEAAMAYDSFRNRVVLFGGDTGSSASDTWEFTPSSATSGTWSQRCLAGACGVNVPTARVGAAMAFDRTRNRIVLYGSSSGTDDNDVYEFDGTTWFRITPTDPEGDGTPQGAGRTQNVLMYDEQRQKMILTGNTIFVACFDFDPDCQDVWEWNGTSFVNLTRTASFTADGEPTARRGHEMFWDAGRGEGVFFGGDGVEMDTWVWNGGFGEKPAHVFHVDFSAAEAPANASLRDVRITWRGGATAAPNGTPSNGTSVSVLRRGVKALVTSAAGTSTAPATATATLSTNLDALFSPSGELLFVEEPQALNGRGNAAFPFGVLTTDYVEARVRYRLP